MLHLLRVVPTTRCRRCSRAVLNMLLLLLLMLLLVNDMMAASTVREIPAVIVTIRLHLVPIAGQLRRSR